MNFRKVDRSFARVYMKTNSTFNPLKGNIGNNGRRLPFSISFMEKCGRNIFRPYTITDVYLYYKNKDLYHKNISLYHLSGSLRFLLRRSSRIRRGKILRKLQ